jgi:flagellar protein FlgJ
MAAFRAFPNIAACLHHYVSLLKTHYPGAVNAGTNAQAFAQGLIQGHYATDPAYAQKLIALAGSAPLAKLP